MRILNVHQRVLAATTETVGALLDGLASPEDTLWPHDRWPAMRFDRPLGVKAHGGHGPIRYTVEAHEPGRRVVFRFTGPRGFDGTHTFEIEGITATRTRLLHVVEMRTHGAALLTWPLLFKPLHDALLEDALDRAERAIGGHPAPRSWSRRVRLLRRGLARRGSSPS